MKNIALHWQILIGMVGGIILGVLVTTFSFQNKNGTLTFVPDETVNESYSYDLKFKAKNLSTKKIETLTRNLATRKGSVESVIVNGQNPITFDLLSGANRGKYEFLSLIKPSSGTSITKMNAGDGNQIQSGDQVNISKQTPYYPKVTIAPSNSFIVNWIKPFGTIFINLLKLIAIPLIIASLVKGVSDLKDISKLSSMGGITIGTYLVTTLVAVTLGLLIVNAVDPGSYIDEVTKSELLSSFQDKANTKIEAASKQKNAGPLQALVDLVPSNIFQAMSSNGNMLQVIFFVIFFGIGLILIPQEKSKPVKDFFDGLNEVILKMIDLIMLAAPFGVFALMAALVAESPSIGVFIALGIYALCVVLGLGVMVFLFYPFLVKQFAGKSFSFFYKGISPAQLLAFSTSSSAATLPVTMERVEEHLGVEKEVTSFVLPIGATINMDGTSLYQAVAAVFIAQVMGFDLTIMDQLMIVFTATLASIGSAAVPGAGMVMLVIVLGAIGVPEAGLALIFAVDRPLDMCRTVVNVTGDAAVSMIVAKRVGKLGEPKVKNWDDSYPA